MEGVKRWRERASIAAGCFSEAGIQPGITIYAGQTPILARKDLSSPFNEQDRVSPFTHFARGFCSINDFLRYSSQRNSIANKISLLLFVDKLLEL